MKVLLMQPPSGWPLADKVFLHEPLALEYLGAGVREDGHSVRIHDCRIDSDMERALTEFQPDIIGLTGYTSQVPVMCRYADSIKVAYPDVKVVIGGHHATVCPEDFNRRSVDAIVIGEGTNTLREILDSGCSIKGGEGLTGIRGLAIPGDPIRYTSIRPYTPLDELPLPDRSLTDKYRGDYFNQWLKPLASIRTSLGCSNRCNFCALWKITGGKYLRRRPESVVEELATIKEKNLFFCDDESMCDLRRMDRLADHIRDAGIHKKYFLYARADTIALNPALFKKWRDIGLHMVFCGMETFSPERLRRMDKELSIEQQERAAAVLNDLGIIMYASFIVDPDFTREDFDALRGYIRRLKLKHISFSVLTPLPGTKLFEQHKDALKHHPPALYDLLHALLPTRLPIKDFYSEFASLYQNAVPLYRSLQVLALYGLRRIPEQFRLVRPVIDRVRKNYLDHALDMREGID